MVRCIYVLFIIGVVLICGSSVNAQCYCNEAIVPSCDIITERAMDPDGTVRCDLVPKSDCILLQCDPSGTLFCQLVVGPTLAFNGTDDICSTEASNLLMLGTFSDELGLQDFMLLGQEVSQTSLQDLGLNNGPLGTVYYVQFTTGTDITSEQILYEDGGNQAGTAFILQSGKFEFYSGTDGIVRETLPAASQFIQTNTFYSILAWFQPSSAAGVPDGAYKIYFTENVDILDLTRADITPLAESTSFQFETLGGNNGQGCGRRLGNVQGGARNPFTGTFAPGEGCKVWGNTSL